MSAKRLLRMVSLIIAVTLFAGVMLTGCGATQTQDTKAQTTVESTAAAAPASTAAPATENNDKKIVVGFSQCVMNHPFRIANVESAKQAAEKYGVELIVTDGQGDVNKEIANIESFIARKVDVIIVSSLSGKAIYPAYKQVAAAGIPLIIAASGVPDDPSIPYTSYVATDEVIMGQTAAKYIAEKLGGKGNLAYIRGVAESTNSELRHRGFTEEIAKYPDIKIVAKQSGEWLRLPAMQVMTNILQANDKIDAVFSENDEMALGAIEAIKKAGRENEMFVVSMDAQKEALEAIKNTKIFDMTIKNEWSLDTAVKLALDVANGKTIEKRVLLDSPAINKDNIDKMYDPNSIF